MPTTNRLEAFSDGVIAVIITIMVLELKVPAADGFKGLVAVLPTLAIYLLSFTFVGVYWVNHHYLVSRLQHVDPLVLWSNLGFLFCLSLLPFFTSYLIDKHLNAFSVESYALMLMITGFGFQALSKSIARHRHRQAATQADEVAEDEEHRAEIVKGWASIALYVSALGVAHWHPQLALGICAAITLVWILPGMHLHPNPQRRSAA